MSPSPRRRIAAFIALTSAGLLIALASAACIKAGQPAETASTPTATSATAARPLPPPVSVSPEPQDVKLADPALAALPGATTDAGRLAGTVYQIEMPDRWNGRLVLYMHGFQGLAPEASVQPPAIRAYLIRHGYAWGASSFSSTALIPGRAADETAALWDLFARKYGRPQRSYIMGESMGGAATFIAAERYGERFDGALGLCGYAGQSAQSRIVGDYFAVGAYVAGVTQTEFDAQPDVQKLIDTRIRPALQDPADERKFEDLLIDLTGGPRPFDREGLEAEDATNWTRASILVSARLSFNNDRAYTLPPWARSIAPDFDRDVVRIAPDPARLASFVDGNETTGNLAMPLLTLHTTGDWQVPVDQEQILRGQVDAAGRGDLLAQRLIQSPAHCGFTQGEWERAFSDLTAWVEDGTKPAGDDVLASDLSAAGASFTLAPRFGSEADTALAGATQRVTVHGTLTLDGRPIDGGFSWVEVRRDGLRQICTIDNNGVTAGSYRRTVASAAELGGCGGPGATVAVAALVKGTLFTTRDVPWPADARDLSIDAAFTAADGHPPNITPLSGAVLDASGDALPPGTTIEAFIGDTLCGASSLPRGVMQFANPDAFGLIVVGPDARPGCASGGAITFRVDGQPVAATATNDLALSEHALDLQLNP